MDPVFLAACAALGMLAGVLGGLLGIGGGIVIVPALVWLLDGFAPGTARVEAIALGTSLASIVFTSLSAAAAQYRRGAIRFGIVRVWAPWVVVGSFASGLAADSLPAMALRTFLGVFLLAVAVIMLSAWTPAPHRALPGRLGSTAIAVVAGGISGLAGIGGGNVIVPVLTFLNVPPTNATATSSALGIPLALAGAAGYALGGGGLATPGDGMLGYIHLPAAAAIVATSVLTAPLGVALAHRLPAARLKRIFGAVLAVVCVRMLLTAA